MRPTASKMPYPSNPVKPLSRPQRSHVLETPAAVESDQFEVNPRPHLKQPTAKWTVLNYCAADNNLYAYIYQDVASMEEFGSTQSVQLVTQLDHLNGGAYRFRVEKDQGREATPDRVDSPVLQSLGKVNMSDPNTLADFIAWGMKKYPSEKTMLLIADHGKGWEGLVQDDSHKGWMSTAQLREALEKAQSITGKRLDVIGFDACQMGSLEVASEIKHLADYMVASQALEGREGWPYSHILGQAMLGDLHQAHLFKSEITPRQVTELIVRSASDHSAVLPTMASIDLKAIGPLEESLAQLVVQLKQANLPGPDLRRLRKDTQAFGFVHDLGHFLEGLEKVAQDKKVPALLAAVHECRQKYAQAILAEHSSSEYPLASGLSVELKQANRDYTQLGFNKTTNWDQVVVQINKA